MPLAGRRSLEVALAGVLTVVLWAGTPTVNLYGTSRPEPIEPAVGAARWPAPQPVVDGVSTPEIHRTSGLPLRIPGERPVLEFRIEREVLERFGSAPFEDAAAAWSTVRGSRLTVRIGEVVDEGVDRNVYDGMNRIFINRRSCVAPTLARAHIDDGVVDDRFGIAVSHVREVNIGICPGMRRDLVGAVVLHEMGHAIGLGHLCDPDDLHDCWQPRMGPEGHRCRVMYVAATACQAWDGRDEEAVIRHYPIAPRVAGPDAVRTSARFAHTVIERSWGHGTVVLLDPEVDDELRWTAAATAGALRAPLLHAPDGVTGCATGEFASELTRVADHGAEVILVGRAAVRCGPQIERWELVGTVVRGVAELAATGIERTATPRGVVVAAVDRDGRVPLGGAAAALAGELRWPLLLAPGGALTPEDVERVRGLPRVRRAVTLGGGDLPVGRAVAQLRWHHGIEVEALIAASAAAASVRIAQHEAFADHGDVLVTRAGGPAETVVAAYAPLTGSLPVVVDERVDPGTGRLLADRAGGGYIVGADLTTTEEVMVNRWVDGERR